MLTDLAVTPIADTLRQLSAAQRSGDLQVRSEKIVKMVFFDHGRLVFAASNLRKDRLGEALVALGRITEDQFRQASGLMGGDKRRRFGDALVHAGVMNRTEVGREVARWVAKILISLFDLQTGAAFFEERACAIPLEYMVSLSVHRILHLGIKTMSNCDLVQAGLGDLDRPLKVAAVPPFSFALKRCSAEEFEVLEQATTRASVRRLASTRQGLSFTRLRTVYALLASGILEEADQDARRADPAPAAQMETSAFLLSSLQNDADDGQPAALRGTLADTTVHAPLHGGASEPAHVSVSTPAAPPSSAEVMELITEADERMATGDFVGAVQTNAKLVGLQPNVAHYRLRLARAMALWPKTARHAEREFVEAVRLDPDDADLHFQFGLYYRAMRVRSPALAEFRTAVRLNPSHRQARAELEALSPHDSALTSLKQQLS